LVAASKAIAAAYSDARRSPIDLHVLEMMSYSRGEMILELGILRSARVSLRVRIVSFKQSVTGRALLTGPKPKRDNVK